MKDKNILAYLILGVRDRYYRYIQIILEISGSLILGIRDRYIFRNISLFNIRDREI